ncbi:MAG: hypothetical protein GX856_08080, partial [Gammaproteobacteria bacterium]|nr:hypothetical protein [Gammaproteobacteria bacterium]
MRGGLRPVLLAGAVLLAPAAHAHHVDPFEVVERAFTAFDGGKGYDAARGVLSAALREAPHNGRLDPDFALVFAVYSDLVRNQDDPSFALQLAEQGLALALDAEEPDEEVRNALVVSRAYALADLGRYREAIETATIAALWLGERFGPEAREGLEAEAREWALQEDPGPDGKVPSALETAFDLLRQAQDALAAYDTATAIMLASRAVLPEGSGLETGAVRTINAWSRQITGIAYAVENRNHEAVATLRGAVDLVAEQPWDGRSRPRLREGLVGEGARYLVWNIFIRLAESALDIGDAELGAAALDVAQDHVATPLDRYALLVQRAALLMHSADLAEVERAFAAGEAEAQAAGDEETAALARFYASVVRLRAASRAGTMNGEGRHMLDRADEAASAAAGNPRQVEYILTSAVWQAVVNAVRPETVLPVARRA